MNQNQTTPVVPFNPCAWCGASFEPVKRGDQRKVFCSTSCRMAFHRAARWWAEQQFFSGKVSARELRAVSSPCTARRLAPESQPYGLGKGPPATALEAPTGPALIVMPELEP